MSLIKFSVVTSTFNASQVLSRTARSLQNQLYRNFEWIIIDGASTDGTIDVIRGFGELVTTLVSEPDAGIYSAWNKALPLLRGDWVLFLGAGDEIYAPETLGEVAALLLAMDADTSIAYGKVVEVDATTGRERRIRSEVWKGVTGPWRGGRPMLPPHQGVFHRAGLFSRFRFDTRCAISADNEILLQELLAGHGADLGLVVSRFLLGGVSDNQRKRLRMIAESIYINMKLGIFFKRPFYQIAVLGMNFGKHVLRLLSARR